MAHHTRRSASKRSRLPLWLAGAGALLLITALVVALTVDGKPAQAQGQVRIPLMDGSTVSLSDYRGQVVLLNFWATWCPPCRAEMPELEAYYQQHRNDGFVLLAVNAGESAELARSFIEANGFSFPVGLDLSGDLTDEFGVTGLPVSIVIDANGVIQYRHSGMISREVLDAQVTPLLGG